MSLIHASNHKVPGARFNMHAFAEVFLIRLGLHGSECPAAELMKSGGSIHPSLNLPTIHLGKEKQLVARIPNPGFGLSPFIFL